MLLASSVHLVLLNLEQATPLDYIRHLKGYSLRSTDRKAHSSVSSHLILRVVGIGACSLLEVRVILSIFFKGE